MNERIRHLRIKVKSLAAEARIIREEARRTRGMEKWELNHHRTVVVRTHTRLNLLAYGLLRGIPYEVMERKCSMKPHWKRVIEIAQRFGASPKDAQTWIDAAKTYLDMPQMPLRLSA